MSDTDTRDQAVTSGRRRARPATTESRKRQIWCVYETDGSDFVIFSTELDALKHAVDHGMKCRPVEFGKSLRDQTA